MSTLGRVLLLASSSPRRRQLLHAAGLEFELCTPGQEVEGSGSPREVANQRARSKAVGAAAGRALGAHEFVLGVDTVVALGADRFDKPVDRDDACAMLRRFEGRDHEVITAHCLVAADGAVLEAAAVSVVRCAVLDDPAREAYLDADEWADKAGGYGIQGAAGAFMELRSGDLDTVIGLSVVAVRRLLAQAGGAA